MPYFTSERQEKGIIIVTKKRPAGAETEKIKSEYPQAHRRIEYPLPLVDDERNDDGRGSAVEYKDEKNGKSRFAVLKMATVLLLLYGVGVYLSELTVPRYMSDLYASAMEAVSGVYERVYADGSFGDSIYVTEMGSSKMSDEIKKAVEKTEKTQGEADKEVSVHNEEAKEVTEIIPHAYKFVNGIDKNAAKGNSVKASSQVQGGSGNVICRDLSRGSDRIYLQNETHLQPDVQALSVASYPIAAISADEEQPQVLILHTHGTESYSDSRTGTSRSTDRSENVVRVGKELEGILNFYGIPTIHSEVMHDEASYITAYASSRREAERILKQHPSIKYVIDLHRDALPPDSQVPVKPYTVINGEGVAQVMLVIGTNAGGGNHPNYVKNLTIASHIQREMNEVYPTLARPINVRNAIFNQNICPGSILLEVGSDANTLKEALSAVRLFADSFARVVLGGDK